MSCRYQQTGGSIPITIEPPHSAHCKPFHRPSRHFLDPADMHSQGVEMQFPISSYCNVQEWTICLLLNINFASPQTLSDIYILPETSESVTAALTSAWTALLHPAGTGECVRTGEPLRMGERDGSVTGER
eukprot:1037589-Rhodomonas_salina.1